MLPPPFPFSCLYTAIELHTGGLYLQIGYTDWILCRGAEVEEIDYKCMQTFGHHLILFSIFCWSDKVPLKHRSFQH